jgi:uncharacterized protein (TIGR00369 family)
MLTIDQGNAILAMQPFTAWLQPTLLILDKQQIELTITVRDALKQHHGFVHGGVLSALADIALTGAGAMHFGDALTCEFKISFLRPAIGDKLIARGLTLRHGKQLAYCEAKIWTVLNGQESLVAAALGTVAMRS